MRRFNIGLTFSILFVLAVFMSSSAQAQTYTVIHNFTGGSDGGNPAAGLTLDGAGNLYGTAYSGGADGYGTVYRLKRSGSSWVLSPLYSFTGGSDGANPLARVIFGPDGALYGTTEFGGTAGTVFKLQPSASACKTALCPWTETVLYAFTGGADGAYPLYSDLIFDQNGNLYGTTYLGGDGVGVVYALTPLEGGWTEAVLYRFSGSDGAQPLNGVIFDSAYNLYGTTYEGGTQGVGTVFQLVHSTQWTESVLYSFQGGSDGDYPVAGLISDQSGNLYGTTTSGGQGGGGTVFELSPGSGGTWKFSVVWDFVGGSICAPFGTLAIDTAGNLYGITRCDGAYGLGNVFKLSPSGGSWTYSSLHDFTGGSDGKQPFGNVVFDAKGNLYGTAASGGSGASGTCNLNGYTGCGVVWEITPN